MCWILRLRKAFCLSPVVHKTTVIHSWSVWNQKLDANTSLVGNLIKTVSSVRLCLWVRAYKWTEAGNQDWFNNHYNPCELFPAVISCEGYSYDFFLIKDRSSTSLFLQDELAKRVKSISKNNNAVAKDAGNTYTNHELFIRSPMD